MLASFRGHYGPDVTLDTPVKIIHFKFKPVQKVESNDVEKTTGVKEVKLYADGGSRGNPGPSASGFVIFDMDGEVIHQQGIYLGVTTNNQAEYLALKFGLEEALKRQLRIVHVHLDSLLVVNQMLGKFKVKNRDLWPIHMAIKELLPQFKQVTFVHVPRALNKDADAMVNEALDKEAETNLQTPEMV
jgi:ribonuclease HI